MLHFKFPVKDLLKLLAPVLNVLDAEQIQWLFIHLCAFYCAGVCTQRYINYVMKNAMCMSDGIYIRQLLYSWCSDNQSRTCRILMWLLKLIQLFFSPFICLYLWWFVLKWQFTFLDLSEANSEKKGCTQELDDFWVSVHGFLMSSSV